MECSDRQLGCGHAALYGCYFSGPKWPPGKACGEGRVGGQPAQHAALHSTFDLSPPDTHTPHPAQSYSDCLSAASHPYINHQQPLDDIQGSRNNHPPPPSSALSFHLSSHTSLPPPGLPAICSWANQQVDQCTCISEAAAGKGTPVAPGVSCLTADFTNFIFTLHLVQNQEATGVKCKT